MALKLVAIASWSLGALALQSDFPVLIEPRANPCGCGKSHEPGFHDVLASRNITSGHGARYYAIHVPSFYNSDLSKPWPLIVDFHGTGGSPRQQFENSLYADYPAGQHYLVAYPVQVDGRWDVPSDLQFTSDLLAQLPQKYCIDLTRVYTSGKSTGGGFVDTLACSDIGDKFAAFAMAAAALYNDTREDGCLKKRAILEAHGDGDTAVPYQGAPDGDGALPDIPTWVTWWGRRCDPSAQARRTGDLGGYDITSIDCAGVANVTQHYRVHGLGHCWPGSTGKNSDAETLPVCNVRALDYTPVVLDFFARWTLQNAPRG